MEIAALAVALAALTISVLCLALFCLVFLLRHDGTGCGNRKYSGPEDSDQADRAREEAEKSRAMDEGFENIMSFSVKQGRFGQEGFGE